MNESRRELSHNQGWSPVPTCNPIEIYASPKISPLSSGQENAQIMTEMSLLDLSPEPWKKKVISGREILSQFQPERWENRKSWK